MAGTREASLDNGPGRRRRRDSDLRRFDDQGQARLFTGPAVLVGPKGGHLVHLLTFLDLGSDSNSTRSGGLEPMPSAFFTAWRARSSMLNLSGRSSSLPIRIFQSARLVKGARSLPRHPRVDLRRKPTGRAFLAQLQPPASRFLSPPGSDSGRRFWRAGIPCLYAPSPGATGLDAAGGRRIFGTFRPTPTSKTSGLTGDEPTYNRGGPPCVAASGSHPYRGKCKDGC